MLYVPKLRLRMYRKNPAVLQNFFEQTLEESQLELSQQLAWLHSEWFSLCLSQLSLISLADASTKKAVTTDKLLGSFAQIFP